ncbi:hypothetical protein [Candidatus Sarmatiella mevalonica]|uniref:hypothetical protein n=1 Tax=Candidatus Sarmatiella mevalonica TaxID=2770581 RepID=UPI0019244F57|nr:hypothetical protein [Candidatus Sarmatiella mevalonica]
MLFTSSKELFADNCTLSLCFIPVVYNLLLCIAALLFARLNCRPMMLGLSRGQVRFVFYTILVGFVAIFWLFIFKYVGGVQGVYAKNLPTFFRAIFLSFGTIIFITYNFSSVMLLSELAYLSKIQASKISKYIRMFATFCLAIYTVVLIWPSSQILLIQKIVPSLCIWLALCLAPPYLWFIRKSLHVYFSQQHEDAQNAALIRRSATRIFWLLAASVALCFGFVAMNAQLSASLWLV